MNVLFFSPQFPPNYINFCTALAQFNCRVLGISSTPYDELPLKLRAALTDYYQVQDMGDYDQVLRAVAYFTHKYGKIDCFESHTEYWLEQDARIRTDFNIPGIKTDQIYHIKRKSLMKAKFIEAGIPVAPGAVVRSLAEAEALIAKTGYPVIAKPDIGVGAANTYKINSPDDLLLFFQNKPPIDYFMEGFIKGRLYSFDGLTDQNGHPVFYTAHCYSQGIMETVNEGLDLAYYSLRDIPPALEEAGLKTVRAFDLRARFFHIEFFIDDADQVVALEVNMRPPGGLTMDMFNYANDIDLYYQWANVIVNNRFDAQYDRPYHCVYVGRKADKAYRHSHQQVMNHFGRAIVQHEPIAGLFSGALGNYGYIARVTDLADVFAIIRYIQARES